MARYTDIDKLIAEYDRVHVGPAGGARKLMVEAPIADVVPKREVEEMKLILATYGLRDRMRLAREIFEEIEELVFQHGRGDLADKYFYMEIDKLKKKYTEGE